MYVKMMMMKLLMCNIIIGYTAWTSNVGQVDPGREDWVCLQGNSVREGCCFDVSIPFLPSLFCCEIPVKWIGLCLALGWKQVSK